VHKGNLKRAPEDRLISLGKECAPIPEKLLLAHAQGEVLFICGAGISRPAGLPDFRNLVLDVYATVDPAVYEVISRDSCKRDDIDISDLNDKQKAERDYDVVLGMLERRLDGQTCGDSTVRNEVAKRLRQNEKPAAIHLALMRLADRGGAISIVTTNFDLLLEMAAKRLGKKAETYSLGAIPRPTQQSDFAGVLHIHGSLDPNPSRASELVLTDHDFGEFYLRRRVVPDFIYDAARIFHLVLVGYSASDAPMRYLLNAVAADGSRFRDLKDRFIFLGMEKDNPVELEDWRSRGITPIPYHTSNDHLALCTTLKRWAELSQVNGKESLIDAEIKRIVKTPRDSCRDGDRDLFDHLYRRGNDRERIRLAEMASNAKADLQWLDAMLQIALERGQ